MKLLSMLLTGLLGDDVPATWPRWYQGQARSTASSRPGPGHCPSATAPSQSCWQPVAGARAVLLSRLPCQGTGSTRPPPTSSSSSSWSSTATWVGATAWCGAPSPSSPSSRATIAAYYVGNPLASTVSTGNLMANAWAFVGGLRRRGGDGRDPRRAVLRRHPAHGGRRCSTGSTGLAAGLVVGVRRAGGALPGRPGRRQRPGVDHHHHPGHPHHGGRRRGPRAAHPGGGQAGAGDPDPARPGAARRTSQNHLDGNAIT